MKRESAKRSLCSKLTSLALAVVMMLSVIGVMPEAVSAAEKTMPAKGGTVTITDNEVVESVETTGGVHWIKYKANANGYLKVKFSAKSSLTSYPYGTMQLYDGKKNKALSSATSFFTDDNRDAFCSDYFGVKKSKTYYIRVVSYGGVKIKGTFKKVTDKAGTKQKKALTMKKKKAVTGVMTAGTSGTHWYKFKLSSPSKLKIMIKPYLTGSVNVYVKGPGAGNSMQKQVDCRVYYSDGIDANAWGSNYPIWDKNLIMKSGTYYIRVTPTSKTCTGYYTLKWQ